MFGEKHRRLRAVPRRDRNLKKYVAFLRAINVGGHAIVKMEDLRGTFVAAGCRKVRTYIQSGNVVFELAERDPARVLRAVRVKLGKKLGVEPEIIFRAVGDIEGIVRRDPFKDFGGEQDVKRYVAFLSRKPETRPRFPLVSSKEALQAVAMRGCEVFIVSRRKKNGSYGFPNNFIEKELGVSATSRNWSTVTKIVEFARQGADA